MTKFELKLLTDFGYVPNGKDEEEWFLYVNEKKHLVLKIAFTKEGIIIDKSGHEHGKRPPHICLVLESTCRVAPPSCDGSTWLGEGEKREWKPLAHYNKAESDMEVYRDVAEEWKHLVSCIESMEDPWGDKDAS